MTHSPVDFREAVLGVMQSDQGAIEVLHRLRDTLPEDYERLVLHLYDRGPRGPNLWDRYVEQCDSDVLVLGRDLKALISENEGWNVSGD